MTRKEISCAFCNKIFLGKYYLKSKYPPSKYCSKICSNKGLIKHRPIKKCKTCHNEFLLVKLKQKGIYCSKKCVRYGGTKESLLHRRNKGFWHNASDEEKFLRLKQLFEKNVIKQEGCWGWRKRPTTFNYSSLSGGKNKTVLGHRISWMIHNGEIPNNLWVLHKCDNPICTNPDHLFLGNHKDNMVDCAQKGRRNVNYGVGHYRAKLNDDKVKEIKMLIKNGYSQSHLGNKFNVSPSTIQNIADEKTWKHIN